MANTDSPFGLRPIRHRNGAAYNGAANPYYINSTYATALFIGDPVVKLLVALMRLLYRGQALVNSKLVLYLKSKKQQQVTAFVLPA